MIRELEIVTVIQVLRIVAVVRELRIVAVVRELRIVAVVRAGREGKLCQAHEIGTKNGDAALHERIVHVAMCPTVVEVDESGFGRRGEFGLQGTRGEVGYYIR